MTKSGVSATDPFVISQLELDTSASSAAAFPPRESCLLSELERRSPTPAHSSRLRLQWLQWPSDHPPWLDMTSRLLKRVSTRRKWREGYGSRQTPLRDSVRIVTSHTETLTCRGSSLLLCPGRERSGKNARRGIRFFTL